MKFYYERRGKCIRYEKLRLKCIRYEKIKSNHRLVGETAKTLANRRSEVSESITEGCSVLTQPGVLKLKRLFVVNTAEIKMAIQLVVLCHEI